MVISSHRSLSPTSRRTSSNSRTPESRSNIRKSFSGHTLTRPSIVTNARSFNPVTPANSPADPSQRNWVCREGIASLLQGSHEHKENEKDQNAKRAKVRSPVVSMGPKNFMAPTISAASKISPSPRKKVLVEKNETVGTSVSVSEEKSPFAAMNQKEFAEEIGSKLEMAVGSQVRSETHNTLEEALSMSPLVSDTSNATATPKTTRLNIQVSEGNPPSINMNPLNFSELDEIRPKPDGSLNFRVLSNTRNLSESLSESRLVGSKNKLSSVLAPVDIDPSVPPYDPKNNYLSPRPQFLHYKPNPRIEVYLDKERGFDPGEGRRLEASFTSESCSKAENTEETQLSDSQKETEDASSELIFEARKETKVSATKPNSTHKKKDVVQAKKISNSHPFVRLKSAPLLLFLVVACLPFSGIDSPVVTPLFKDHALSKLHSTAKIAELAKANLDELGHDFKLWSVKSILYLSELISIPREMEDLGSFHLMNLTTALDEEISVVDGYRTIDFGGHETEEKQEKNSQEPKKDAQTEEEPKREQNYTEIETEGKIDELTTEERCNIVFEEQSTLISQALEIKPEMSEAADFYDQENFDSRFKIEPLSVEVTSQSSESDIASQSSELKAISKSLESGSQNVDSHSTEPLEFSVHSWEDNSPLNNGLGIASVLLTLIASTMFLYLKRKNTTQDVSVPVEQFPPKKMVSSSLSASSDNQNLYNMRLYSQNWPTEVVEMVGQSGPFEMSSSFLNSLSCNRRGSERDNEVQSHERNLRRDPNRESLASSSSEYSAGTTTPSYGSFTTYEKIHSKNVCGEEVVTPVRRSSRIRKQITSP